MAFPQTGASPVTNTMFGRAPALANRGMGDPSTLSDPQLIEIFERCKRESFADRWIFERQWTRNIHYVNQRQWLAPYNRQYGWRDARLAKGIPRPTTSKPKEAVQAIRAMFTAIQLGVNARPTSRDPKAIITASTCDDLVPVLHDVHDMDDVLNEGDYSLIVLGNKFEYTWWDANAVHGEVEIPYEKCAGCGLELRQDVIAQSKQQCPQCHGQEFTPALNQDQTPRVDALPKGCAVTTPLTPLELAFPLGYARWKDVPFLIRMRWRDKRYYEEHPELKQLVPSLVWSKSATEQSLQIFQSLPFQNDLGGIRGGGGYASGTQGNEAEGIAEYELWIRPTPEHPEGLVARFAGDSTPTVLHLEDEGLPGPLPYRDAKDRPLFTFTHAAYEHVGGRVLGSGALDPVISKIDTLNRYDSLVEMIVTRMAIPFWKIPKGAEVQWLGDSPAMPGQIVEWNAQLAGAEGEPKIEQGVGPDRVFAQIREQLERNIDEGFGTFDILKGAKPAGVEAFAAMHLLVERGEARFANAFRARGKAYKQWAVHALELERQFGPDERTWAVMTPARTYAFQTFKRANIGGDIAMVMEDGTSTPKTTLGMRASVEHLNQLTGNTLMQDSATRYAVFTLFGRTDLIPGIDIQQQGALRRQEAFEQWLTSGAAQKVDPNDQTWPDSDVTYPLRWKRWYDAEISRDALLQWANGDKMQKLFQEYPAAEQLVEAHLQEIDLSIQQKMMGMMDPQGNAAPQPPQGKAGVGAGRAMANSNQNSAPVGNTAQPDQAMPNQPRPM